MSTAFYRVIISTDWTIELIREFLFEILIMVRSPKRASYVTRRFKRLTWNNWAIIPNTIFFLNAALSTFSYDRFFKFTSNCKELFCFIQGDSNSCQIILPIFKRVAFLNSKIVDSCRRSNYFEIDRNRVLNARIINYLHMQCPAVRTCLLVSNDPPQK